MPDVALPLTYPVTVQLKKDGSPVCLESTFTSTNDVKNTSAPVQSEEVASLTTNTRGPCDKPPQGTFLSAIGVVQRLLFPGNGREHVSFSALRRLLGIDRLPAIESVGVRNSWEHLDERYDELLARFEVGWISQLHVHELRPSNDAIVFKRFNPRSHSIHFLDSTVMVGDCLRELTELKSGIATAIASLDHLGISAWEERRRGRNTNPRALASCPCLHEPPQGH